MDSETFHLHHVSEKIDEVVKFIAHQKIKSYQQYVESQISKIPLSNLEDIVSNVTDRVITKKKITELCCDAYLDGIGNTECGYYYTRSIFTLNRVKKELTRKTLDLIKETIATEIRDEILRFYSLNPRGEFELNTIVDAFKLVYTGLLVTILYGLASLVNPIAEIVVILGYALLTIVTTPNLNSTSWRKDVAMEIYQNMFNRRNEMKRGISSIIRKILKDTSDELTTVVERLENFRRRIDL